MGQIEHNQTVCCPRCGYDQRGELVKWTTECPLASICTECGLLIDWPEHLSTKRRRPGWCVEFGRGLRSLLGRTFLTMCVSHWPWAFWSSLKMSHDIRPRRFVGYWVLLLGIAYILFALGQVMIAEAYWRSVSTWSGAPLNVTPYDYLRVFLLPLTDWTPGVAGAGGGTGSWTPTFGGTWTPTVMSPRELFAAHWGWLLPAAGFPLVFQTTCAATFLALPVSRRVAKVRWRHILRAALYGLGPFMPPLILSIISCPLRQSSIGVVTMLGYLFYGIAFLMWWGLPFLLFIWWSTATGRYLKMRHPWGVGLAVVLIGGLLLFFLAVSLSMMQMTWFV